MSQENNTASDRVSSTQYPVKMMRWRWFPPKARKLLARFDQRLQHYEVRVELRA